MKTFHSLLAVAAVTLLLAAAPVLRAGPPPDYSNRLRPVAGKPTPTVQTIACNQAGKVCTNCQSCAGCSAKTATKAKS
jgi:hypothetical protein